jgi:hypothetical protein
VKNDIFIKPQYIPATVTSLFNNNDIGKEAFIKNITIHNTHDASVTVKLYNVPDDETLSDEHKFYEVTMGTLETDIIDLLSGIGVSTNGSIHAVASVADKVTVQASGVR